MFLLKTRTQVSLVGLGHLPRAVEHQQVLGCRKIGKSCFGWHRLGRPQMHAEAIEEVAWIDSVP